MFNTQNVKTSKLNILKDYIGCIMLSLLVLLGYEYELDSINLKALDGFNFNDAVATPPLLSQWHNVQNRLSTIDHKSLYSKTLNINELGTLKLC